MESAAQKTNSDDVTALADPAGNEPCPACGCDETRPLMTAQDSLYQANAQVFHIVECKKCRLVRLHPQPVPSELQEYYPRDYWLEPDHPRALPLESAVRRVVLHDRLHFMERSLRESMVLSDDRQGSSQPGSNQAGLNQSWIVDVGCGGGLTLQMLAQRGWKNVIGLEFGVPVAAEVMRQRGFPVICGTFSRAPFATGGCALVSMFHVLEHLYDPASYLEAAHRCLAPEGRLILQSRNAASWQFLLFGSHWAGVNTPRHLVQFRRKDVESLLDECGFEILRERHFNWPESTFACAASLMPWLDPSVRRLRGITESKAAAVWKDIAYYTLSALCLPFVLVEAACHAGGILTIEARKKMTIAAD